MAIVFNCSWSHFRSMLQKNMAAMSLRFLVRVSVPAFFNTGTPNVSQVQLIWYIPPFRFFYYRRTETIYCCGTGVSNTMCSMLWISNLLQP